MFPMSLMCKALVQVAAGGGDRGKQPMAHHTHRNPQLDSSGQVTQAATMEGQKRHGLKGDRAAVKLGE